MNCRETQQLIDAYADGEVDLVRSVELETHLEDCGTCLHALKSTRAIKDAIRGSSLRYDAPKGLESRMLAAARNDSQQRLKSEASRWRQIPFRVDWATAALALAAAAALFLIFHLNKRPDASDTLADELVSSHVHSLMASHLFDVASSDKHTVKPWFAGKLDYSPNVVDLADRGYPLVGGRLDYITGRPVAALVYQHRKHVINLFEWPSSIGAAAPAGVRRTESVHGYHTVEWSTGGMTYHAVSDVNPADLQEFATELKAAAGP